MKMQLSCLAAVVFATVALTVPANDEHHPADAKAAATNSKAVKPADKAVTEQMQKMQAARDKLTAAKSPEERQSAMRDGMMAMKDGMTMMREMHGGKGCMGMMGKNGDKAGGMDMGGMVDMMMQMMDQESSMMAMPMGK